MKCYKRKPRRLLHKIKTLTQSENEANNAVADVPVFRRHHLHHVDSLAEHQQGAAEAGQRSACEDGGAGERGPVEG